MFFDNDGDENNEDDDDDDDDHDASIQKGRDTRREFLFLPLRGTKKGVVQALFDP